MVGEEWGEFAHPVEPVCLQLLQRGGQLHVVLIIELRDGKVARETRFYAEPFEAPQWQAHLVEPLGEAAT